MDVSHLLDSLNNTQREAVCASPEHTLVLAGAGSGKTRVLVHRIAFLLETEQARPYNLLAVTFTNKAAREMQYRIETLLKRSPQGLWAGTFHGIAHRLLRIHWQEATLPQTFQILDSEDQERTLKRIIKVLQLDEKVWTAKQSQHFINHQKDRAIRPHDILVGEQDVWLGQMVQIYQMYEEHCQRTGAVDFAELLLRSYETLRDNDTLLTHYQVRFHHILVDEFQDTNTIQYLFLKLLAGEQGKLFVVGDDDQSIYSWRGAKVENIQNFGQDFENSKLIRLEQNYRSTGTILEVANALINHNKQRLGKRLWTEGKAGEPVYLYKAFSELDEADFVVSKIKAWEGKLNQIAILYRTSSQSRIFEERLIEKSIPYRIYGGIRFYERAEIKDVLAYLRLIALHDDDGAFERIINLPKRGIGDKTVETVRAMARKNGLSLWQAAQQLIQDKALSGRAHNTLHTFLLLIQQITEAIKHLSLKEQVLNVMQAVELAEHYKKAGKEEAQRRLENLDELVTAAKQFSHSGKDGMDPLTAFLAHSALESGETQAGEFSDCVQLMTLHLAKGLEFDIVFLCGLEEGLFPHQNSIKEGNLEEERRLCYVGITRAQQRLYLTHSESRYRWGLRESASPSRFLSEIPTELLEYIRLQTTKSLGHPNFSATKLIDFEVGQWVKHAKFGEGLILEREGEGNFCRIYVKFSEGGKWLLAAFANLEVI